MKLGTINELGKSHVVVKVDDEFACKLNDLEKAIGNKLSNNLIEFIRSANNEELFSKLQKNINNVRKIDIKGLDWLPPITNPSKILGVAFNNKELMNMVNEIKEAERLDEKIFTMMARNCGKKDDYFKKKVFTKKHADWFITADEAKKHNLANQFRVPKIDVKIAVDINFE